ncbi:glycosyltransferase [Verrucomicrobiaceae bacterium 5K15]|uniref:Glycosyltransferase n=1 Tax=Oceaniferula flava TaxID=2800421 RepID=A0AAE2SA72_9BACT|nr:glycosyltransferase [Oceaniferula flavus]MBK1854628.1 glycosyltransferase [Oceaniferula flavus]MBM1135934.1 glycosyltransferase [Oceaniferula flavus]
MLLLIPIISLLCAPAIWVIFGRPRYVPIWGKAPCRPISVIIPARDEEKNIHTLLTSLNELSVKAHEVIVVNDGSTDRTAEIARDLGAMVFDSKPLPTDWKGKPWACQQGAELATGEWLLFLDADTRLEPKAIAQLRHLTDHENHVFSICPWHTVKRPYEQLSAFFNLLMVVGMNAFSLDRKSIDDTRLVGQCILIPSSIYRECGGHASVRGEILENYQLSKVLKSMGIKRCCYLGKNSVTMRMFPGGLIELWRSWKKGFISGAAEVPGMTIFWTSLWITGMVTATVALALVAAEQTPLFLTLSASAYLIHAMQCWIVFRRVGSFAWYNALLFPVSLIFYHLLFFTAIIDQKRGKTTQWKGREVS